MERLSYLLLSIVFLFVLPTAVKPQTTRTVERTVDHATNKSVPEEYTGQWVCQTGLPGLTTIHSNVNVNTGVLEQTTAFREAARRNVETLKAATIDDLLHAGWGPGK
jgi:hypothetical protein